MPYASQNDIMYAAGGTPTAASGDRFVSLSDWNGDGAVDADVIAAAQAYADGYINSFLCKRYTTPIAVPSAALVSIAAAECVWWMRDKRGMLARDEQTDRDRKDREHQLEMMVSGKMSPGDPLPQQGVTAVAGVVSDSSSGDGCGVVITRESLKGSIW